MKTVSSLVSGLKFVLKYAALIAVVVKIVQFAIDEFEKVGINSEPAPAKLSKSEDNDEQA